MLFPTVRMEVGRQRRTKALVASWGHQVSKQKIFRELPTN